MASGGERGSVLAEAIAAVALVAAAGMVVAAAASTSLRAVRQAALIERAVTIAARELSSLQARGAPESSQETALDEPALGHDAALAATVNRRGDGIAELRVAVNAPALRLPMTLTTRMLVAE